MRPHPGQEQVLNNPTRFKVVACGRRWGKTQLGMTHILIQAWMEKKRCWWLTPTRQMASQVWRDLKNSIKPLKNARISETERRIDFPDGGMIALRSAHNPDNLRGEGLDLVLLDEAAFMPRAIWTAVIRPMLVTTRGEALFLSTPNGHNWFHELYQLGNDPLETEWQSFNFPTAANPLIPSAELDNIQRRAPERVWKSEYLAQFHDAGAQVFRRIRDAIAADQSHAPQPGHTYVAGIDWGRNNDFTAIAIIDTTDAKMIALERFNQVGWDLQRGRLKQLVDHWKPNIIWAEANSIGEPNIDALIREGIPVRPFVTTAKSKPPLIESLALAIERGDIRLLNDPVLLHELENYALEKLPRRQLALRRPARQPRRYRHRHRPRLARQPPLSTHLRLRLISMPPLSTSPYPFCPRTAGSPTRQPNPTRLSPLSIAMGRGFGGGVGPLCAKFSLCSLWQKNLCALRASVPSVSSVEPTK